MKKILIIVLLIFVLILIGVFYWTQHLAVVEQNAIQNANPNVAGNSATIANPASVFCVNNGGKSEITTASDGSQGGKCVWSDGSSCDEWAYFRKECKPASPGDITPISIGGKSGVKGKVTLSPVCSVEKVSPDPACAPKPYSTTILIIKGSTTIKTIQSGVDGTFSAELSPGAYTVQGLGKKPLPRCGQAEIVIRPDEIVTADISCDSGIR